MDARQAFRIAVVAAAGAALAACASIHPQYATGLGQRPAKAPSGAGGGYKVGAPYQVNGVWYTPREQPDYNEVGVASWYGDQFNLKPTANGEIFDKDIPSAAHKTLPIPSLVEVTNLDNGKKLVVRVNDRGPFVDGRIIDLSHEAARELGYDQAGLARVRVRYVGPAQLYNESSVRYASNTLRAPSRRAAAAVPLPKPRSAPADTAPASDIILTAAAAPKAPMVVQKSLAPLTGAELPALGPRAAVAKHVASAAAQGGFRIQAGAFSTPENAQKAVAQLAACGPASVLPLERDGVTLYRVIVEGASDAQAAEALRRRVAEAGFADAQVLKPSA